MTPDLQTRCSSRTFLLTIHLSPDELRVQGRVDGGGLYEIEPVNEGASPLAPSWMAGHNYVRAFRMAEHLLLFRCYNSPSAMSKIASRPMTEWERLAVDRVLRARVKAPEYAILGWVRSIGAESVLSAQLCDIRAVANAF